MDANNDAYYNSSTELADLGRERFDLDTAAIGDRDYAFNAREPVHVQQGRAPQGLERQIFAWNSFKHRTEERDEREELKGDLHEGQLHRQNRAAASSSQPTFALAQGTVGSGGRRGGRSGRGDRDGRNARGGHSDQGGSTDHIRAAYKPDQPAPPLAKGFAEELSADMFWNEPIV